MLNALDCHQIIFAYSCSNEKLTNHHENRAHILRMVPPVRVPPVHEWFHLYGAFEHYD